jgi:hypothetical protein
LHPSTGTQHHPDISCPGVLPLYRALISGQGHPAADRAAVQ